MGASLLWTLRFILFFVVICKQTTGDRATLDVPQHTVFLEERVTLICTGQDGKQLQFYKDGSLVQRDTQHLLLQGLNKAYLKMDFVSKSNEGLYSCGANEETQSPEKELKVTENTRRIELTVSNTDIPVGGSVTLSCDVEDWNGELQLLSVKAEDDSEIQNLGKEQTLSVTDRGVYYCRPWDRHVSTKRSNDVTVVDTAPTVSVSQLVFVGESLTLRCEVEGGADTEWTYHWSRNRLNLPPTTREYTVSSVTESDTGTYSCRAQRGPHHTTVWSTNTSVTVLNVESPVSLSVSPDRAQHFTDDVITLSCGFNSPGADRTVYRSFSNNRLSTQQCSNPRRKDESKCEFSLNEKTSAVFWCESGSGERSNGVSISVHSDIILMSPVRAVTEGQSVSLSCKLKTGTLTSVCFYKNGKMIQNGTKPQLNISALSRSDQGFYKCEGQKGSAPLVSLESWMSVQSAPKGDVSSLSVMWIIGPVCAVVLLILLLLLWRFSKTKDLCFQSFCRTQRTNQSSAEDHVTSSDVTSPPNDVAYSVLELKNVRERRNAPQDESCVYSEVNPHSSGESVTYAQVNHHKKERPKAASCSASDDTVYSQIKETNGAFTLSPLQH